jgi:hypothetical protein
MRPAYHVPLMVKFRQPSSYLHRPQLGSVRKKVLSNQPSAEEVNKYELAVTCKDGDIAAV